MKPIDAAVAAATEAWLAARAQYWRQWGITTDYPETARTEVATLIRRHRRRPDILAAKMEKLTYRLDSAYIARIESPGQLSMTRAHP
jgi:hypothetical protein